VPLRCAPGEHSQPVSVPALQVVPLAPSQQPPLAAVPNGPLVLCFSFQLFTEYGRLAMEETFLKPFQVSPRVLASTCPLARGGLALSPLALPRGVTAVCGTGRRWGRLGTGSAVPRKDLVPPCPQRGFQKHPTSLFLSPLNLWHPKSSALSCQMSRRAWRAVRFCSRFLQPSARGLCPACARRDWNPPARGIPAPGKRKGRGLAQSSHE